MNDDNFISQRVAELREHVAKMSAREMSLAMGQTPGYINKIEKGGMSPSIKALFSICEFFGISIIQFFDIQKDIDGSRKACLIRYITRDIEQLEESALENLYAIIKQMIQPKT